MTPFLSLLSLRASNIFTRGKIKRKKRKKTKEKVEKVPKGNRQCVQGGDYRYPDGVNFFKFLSFSLFYFAAKSFDRWSYKRLPSHIRNAAIKTREKRQPNERE